LSAFYEVRERTICQETCLQSNSEIVLLPCLANNVSALEIRGVLDGSLTAQLPMTSVNQNSMDKGFGTLSMLVVQPG